MPKVRLPPRTTSDVGKRDPFFPTQLLAFQQIFSTALLSLHLLRLLRTAVIRTQPFDLLRWSAAYFRCLALERTPPVKPRYEPELRRGRLSAGALRVLIDQVIIYVTLYGRWELVGAEE